MSVLKVTNYQEKVNIPKFEVEVLKYWEENKTFEKSIQNRPEDKRYVFYDGPPFATGLPHYGHILTSIIKDVIPRYWTMKGYRVDRVWGWDCHGIPIENMIEKELGLKGGKKGIETMGIDKFNAACRTAILRFDKEWEKVIHRIGRWVDFKHSYKTMDITYMESVWWAFGELVKKNLVYEGRRIILYCPRCATPLSNFEIAMDNSYKDVVDNSVYVKFRVKGTANEYFLAWTTTPWTLIGNVALAVDAQADYVKVKVGDEYFWIAKALQATVLGLIPEQRSTLIKTLKGIDLVGLEYDPLFSYMPVDGKKAFYVASADFVLLTDGTGIVHTAAIYGEDDYKLAVALDLPRVPTLDDQGKFLDFVTQLKGVFYKKSEAWIITDLTKRGLMFHSGKITHSYPFCYRCDSPLYYNAVPAWFINIARMKKNLLAQNEHISWYPEYLKYGRFGNGLQSAPDWNISRSRYWGTPMPVWIQYQKEKKLFRIIGSIEELKKWAVRPDLVERLTDIHREFLDDLEVWVDDRKTVKGKRIPEVFDCWIESGSMPFASVHYPFENKKLFESTHPGQFIVEYISQTRAWFYTLHVMSVGLFNTHTFDNALTHGVIQAEDGTKMSKSKKNYPDPTLLFEKYGVDALRFYLTGSVVMKGENVNFSEIGVKEIYQKVVALLWNTFSFYKLYANEIVIEENLLESQVTHDLDKWIVSKTHTLIENVTTFMDKYDTVTACRIILEFIDDVSTWYLRESRGRFKEDPSSMVVFSWVLRQLALILAPFAPFIAEIIWQNLIGKSSVHLIDWPGSNKSHIDQNLEMEMEYARKVVEQAHATRKAAQIKVRQPLATLSAVVPIVLRSGIVEIIKEEVNVKEFLAIRGKSVTVELDTVITKELATMGETRELIRKIQDLRKANNSKFDELVAIVLPKSYKKLSKKSLDQICKKTLVRKIIWGEKLSIFSG